MVILEDYFGGSIIIVPCVPICNVCNDKEFLQILVLGKRKKVVLSMDIQKY